MNKVLMILVIVAFFIIPCLLQSYQCKHERPKAPVAQMTLADSALAHLDSLEYEIDAIIKEMDEAQRIDEWEENAPIYQHSRIPGHTFVLGHQTTYGTYSFGFHH